MSDKIEKFHNRISGGKGDAAVMVPAATVVLLRDTADGPSDSHQQPERTPTQACGADIDVGEPSSALRTLHQQHDLTSSAFVTAYNPFSEALTDAQNEVRHRADLERDAPLDQVIAQRMVRDGVDAMADACCKYSMTAPRPHESKRASLHESSAITGNALN